MFNFESGLNFEQALKLMREGKRVTRWTEEVWLNIDDEEQHYIYINDDGEFCGCSGGHDVDFYYSLTLSDLLAEDWRVV